MTTMTHEVQVHTGDLSAEFTAEAILAGQVAWDIETSGLDWRTERIGTVQVHVPTLGTAIVQVGAAVPERLRDLLQMNRVQKVLHHAPFDMRFMAHHWRVDARNIACTKVASRVLHPDWKSSEHSLKPLVESYLGVRLEKGSVRTSDWSVAELTAEQREYAARDVLFLIPLLEELMKEAVDQGLADVVESSFAYLPMRVKTDLLGCGDVFAY